MISPNTSPRLLSRVVQSLMLGSSLATLSVTAIANEAKPSTILPTIEVTASDELIEQATSSTGLNLDKKKTAQSTSSVNKQHIDDQKLTNLSEALNATTGVTVLKTDTSRNSITSRGYAVDRFMIDGMDYNFTGGWNSGEDKTSLDTLERIDVVRGSTGLMSGVGNASAAVNLVRKHATSKERRGEISVSHDSFNHYGVMLDYGQALNQSGSVRGRFVASHNNGDTFIDRERKGKSLAYAALDVDITPNTLLALTAKYEDNQQRAVMWGGLPSTYSTGQRTDWSVDANIAPNWSKWDSNVQDYSLALEHKFNDRWSAKLQGNYLQSEADLALVFAGLQPALDGTINATMYPAKYDVKTNQSNIQLKINGGFDLLGRSHQLAFGADQSKYDYDVLQQNTASYAVSNMQQLFSGNVADLTLTGSPFPYGYSRSTKKTAFASAQLQLLDPLSLVLGTRLVDFSSENFNRWLTAPATQDIDAKLTKYAGLTFDVNKNVSLYTSYSDIFQPQSNAPRNADGAFLDKPITGVSYEFGVKANNDDNTLQGQISLFQSKRENVTEAVTGVLVANTTNEQAYRYVDGTEKRQGVEVEVTGQILPNWHTTFGYSWVKSEDAKGEKTNTSTPAQTAKLFTTYRLPMLEGLTLGLGANYMSRYYTSDVLSQKAVTVVNAMARYDVTPQTHLQLNVDNIGNEKYVSSFGWSQISYAEPRKATLSLTHKF